MASVSVVTPCYRCGATILRAVESVLCQTLMPTELILVNDASGDETLSILQELAVQHPNFITVIDLDVNKGAANARNVGWERATQEYIAFLDADDAWHPKKIEIQYNYMNLNKNISLSGHGHCIFDSNNTEKNWKFDAWENIKLNRINFLLSNQFVTPSVMLRREISQRFKVNRRHMEDHLLWLEIIFSGALVTMSPSKLAAIYKASFGSSGLSAELWKMQLGDLSNYVELYSKRHINLLECIFFLSYSLLKYVRRLAIYSLKSLLKK